MSKYISIDDIDSMASIKLIKNLNTQYLQGHSFSQFFRVYYATSVDCNNVEQNNSVYHSSNWTNFVGTASNVTGTLVTLTNSAQWQFQLAFKYDAANVGAGVWVRLYNGTNKAWTAWKSLISISLTAASLSQVIENLTTQEDKMNDNDLTERGG